MVEIFIGSNRSDLNISYLDSFRKYKINVLYIFFLYSNLDGGMGACPHRKLMEGVYDGGCGGFPRKSRRDWCVSIRAMLRSSFLYQTIIPECSLLQSKSHFVLPWNIQKYILMYSKYSNYFFRMSIFSYNFSGIS